MHPVVLKIIVKVLKQKVSMMFFPSSSSSFSCSSSTSSSSSSSSSSDGLVQICVTLSQWFSHKTVAFSTEQCTSPSLFPGLKSHEAGKTAHWRTMASFVMPFSLHVYTCTQSTQWQNVIITQDCWIRNTIGVQGVFEESLVWTMILQPMLLCDRWQTSAQHYSDSEWLAHNNGGGCSVIVIWINS